MSSPPPPNRHFVKIDDAQFYEVITIATQQDVTALARRLENICMDALRLGADLRAAAAVNVAGAEPLVQLMDTVEAFSNEEKATQFLAALRAIQGA